MKSVVAAFAALGGMLVACAAPSSSSVVGSQSELANAPSPLPVSATVCTDANKAALIAEMLAQPIQPPRYAAGLDLAGDDHWSGIVQATVEKAYCKGIADGSDDSSAPNPLSYFIWGSDGNTYPVEAGFDANHKLGLIAITHPYTGGIGFRSRPGSRFGGHTYTMAINKPIARDGQPFVIDWAQKDALAAAATELADALVFTFAPELPAIVADCVQSKRCSVDVSAPTENDDGGGMVGVLDLGLYIHVPDQDVSAPAGSPSPSDYFYMFPKAPHLSAPEPAPRH